MLQTDRCVRTVRSTVPGEVRRAPPPLFWVYLSRGLPLGVPHKKRTTCEKMPQDRQLDRLFGLAIHCACYHLDGFEKRRLTAGQSGSSRLLGHAIRAIFICSSKTVHPTHCPPSSLPLILRPSSCRLYRPALRGEVVVMPLDRIPGQLFGALVDHENEDGPRGSSCVRSPPPGTR